jgi:hypothetical protein
LRRSIRTGWLGMRALAQRWYRGFAVAVAVVDAVGQGGNSECRTERRGSVGVRVKDGRGEGAPELGWAGVATVGMIANKTRMRLVCVRLPDLPGRGALAPSRLQMSCCRLPCWKYSPRGTQGRERDLQSCCRVWDAGCKDGLGR